jgi:hypothetical protein
MEINVAQQTVQRTGIATARKMEIDGNDPVIWQFFSDQLYTNQLRWVLEYAQNARDADPNWKLIMPTKIVPEMHFVDNGASMSRDFMLNEFCLAGKSTKRGDNAQSGGFGIGRLSGPQGTIFECRNPDMIRTWTLIKDENKIPTIILLSEEPRPADVKVGTTVRVPIDPSKMMNVISETQKMLRFFDIEGFPKVEYLINNPTWALLKAKKNHYNTFDNDYPHIVVGGYTFKISEPDFPSEVRNGYGSKRSKNEQAKISSVISNVFGTTNNLLIRVPIGSVDIALNRESLKFTDRTVDTLVAAATVVATEYVDLMQKEIAKCLTLWEARRFFSNMGWEQRRLYQFCFELAGLKKTGVAASMSYNGITIDSENFHFDEKEMKEKHPFYCTDMNSVRRRRSVSSEIKTVPLAYAASVYISVNYQDRMKIVLSKGNEDRPLSRYVQFVKPNTFLIVIKDEKGEFQKWLDLLGNPPQELVVNLWDYAPPAIVRTPRDKSVPRVMKVFELDQGGMTWDEKTLSLGSGTVYTTSRGHVMDNEFQWFPSAMGQGSTFRDWFRTYLPAQVVRIPASSKKVINDDWVSLNDYLTEKMTAELDNMATTLEARQLYVAFDCKITSLVQKLVDSRHQRSKSVPQSVLTFLENLNKLEAISKQYNPHKEMIAVWLKLTGGKSKLVKELSTINEQQNKMLERYQVLKVCKHLQTSYLQQSEVEILADAVF